MRLSLSCFNHMHDLELVPGGTDTPTCRCGKEMRRDRAKSPFEKATHILVYKCPVCNHELRLTVWGADDINEPDQRLMPVQSIAD